MQSAPRPAWLAPAVIGALVALIVVLGRKEEKAYENPLVDLTILTVGVFALAHVFRWVGYQLGAPGLSTFFGAPAASTATSNGVSA